MTLIDFSQNQLVGNVNDFFGDDTAATGLTTILLDDNALTGEFPTAALSFPELGTLQLHRNSMAGLVPDTICDVQGIDPFLTTFTADCLVLWCECCTTCY